jgi:D-tyrosyl-tRNA(Tyr) deacylase
LLQRVSRACVRVRGESVAGIEKGLLVFVGVQRNDGKLEADRLLERILTYRVFADDEGRMNCSVTDKAGALLFVPQFTLAADTRKGTRPGFSAAAGPEQGRKWFEYLVGQALCKHENVASGQFGANMQVGLVNDGPVTFWLEVRPDVRT